MNNIEPSDNSAAERSDNLRQFTRRQLKLHSVSGDGGRLSTDQLFSAIMALLPAIKTRHQKEIDVATRRIGKRLSTDWDRLLISTWYTRVLAFGVANRAVSQYTDEQLLGLSFTDQGALPIDSTAPDWIIVAHESAKVFASGYDACEEITHLLRGGFIVGAIARARSLLELIVIQELLFHGGAEAALEHDRHTLVRYYWPGGDFNEDNSASDIDADPVFLRDQRGSRHYAQAKGARWNEDYGWAYPTIEKLLKFHLNNARANNDGERERRLSGALKRVTDPRPRSMGRVSMRLLFSLVLKNGDKDYQEYAWASHRVHSGSENVEFRGPGLRYLKDPGEDRDEWLTDAEEVLQYTLDWLATLVFSFIDTLTLHDYPWPAGEEEVVRLAEAITATNAGKGSRFPSMQNS